MAADKKHTFFKPYGNTDTGIGTITSMHSSLVKYFTITLTHQKQLPAVLKYNGVINTQPTNFMPLLALGYASVQNQSPDVATTQIGLSYTSTLYYKEDA